MRFIWIRDCESLLEKFYRQNLLYAGSIDVMGA